MSTPRHRHRIDKSYGFTWKFLIDFYDASLRSSEITDVCRVVGVSLQILKKWMEDNKVLREIADLAAERRDENKSFATYIYGKLSDKAQKTWDELQLWGSDENRERVDMILNGASKKIKQEMFIHAMIRSGFDLSSAVGMVGISWQTFEGWKRNDPEFRMLIEEIHWHKKNFVESKLMNLVESGHPNAIIFTNRTLNRDRGYQEKINIEHSGRLEVGFSLEDLQLDVQTKVKILEAIRRKKENLVQDAEVISETERPTPLLAEKAEAA